MLKKKKQSTYLRFGLKPQQGHIVSTYCTPIENYSYLVYQEYQQAFLHERKIMGLYITSNSFDNPIEIDRLAPEDWQSYWAGSNIENKDYQPPEVRYSNVPGYNAYPGSFESDYSLPSMEWQNIENGGFYYFVYIDENKNICYRHAVGEKSMTVINLNPTKPEWEFTGNEYNPDTGFYDIAAYTYTPCKYIGLRTGPFIFNALYGLVRLDKPGGVQIYELRSGSIRTIIDPNLFIPHEDIYPVIQGVHYDIVGLAPYRNYNLAISENWMMTAKEKKLTKESGYKESTENTLYTTPLYSSEYEKEVSCYLDDGGLYVHTLIDVGSYSVVVMNGSEFPTISLSPMMGIFQVVNKVVDGDVYPAQREKTYKLIDKYGDHTTTVWNERKVISNINNPNISQSYFWWWTDDNALPTILKSNDSDQYLVKDGLSQSFLIKDNQFHFINPSQYKINSQTFDVSDFVEYFTCEGMLSHLPGPGKGVDSSYDLTGWFQLSSHLRNKGYMISSWYGNYIYRVRVDQIIPEPDYTEAILYGVDLPENTNPNLESERLIAKTKLENDYKTKGDSFLFDAIANIKNNDTALKDFASTIRAITGTPAILKIYNPSTTALWVEKYELRINGSSAQIHYLDRFLTPVVVPLRDRLKSFADWDIDTLHDLYTFLKSICYVPFD